MRNKKLLSTLLASALAVTMVMPVAADTGNVPVTITTKTGVLRVQVPTKMGVQVDQFQIIKEGAQIASDNFDMTNYSEMDVKVDITSTVATAAGVTLVSKKSDVGMGDAQGEAWLAVASKTSATSGEEYDDASTNPKTEGYEKLSDANKNVTTFGTDKIAKQTYYLAKSGADGTTTNATYKMAVPDSSNKVTAENYAQFYELTKMPTQPTDNATLKAAADDKDVYVLPADGGSPAAETDDVAMQIIRKKSESVTWAADDAYYTAAETPTALAALANGKKYVYAAMSAAGGKAGFRYVGKLSDKKATWTSTDISTMTLAYEITGVTADNYKAVKDDCTYGLYKKPAPVATAPSAPADYQLVAGTAASIQLNLGSGDKAAEGVDAVLYNDGDDVLGTTVTYADGKLTIAANIVDQLRGFAGEQKITVVFDDGEPGTRCDIILKK